MRCFPSLAFVLALQFGSLLAENPKPTVILDGRVPQGKPINTLSTETQDSYLKQLFPDAAKGAILFYNGMTKGSYTGRGVRESLVLGRWEGSPNIKPEELMEWRAGLFSGNTMIRRLSVPSGFSDHTGIQCWSLHDLDGDGADEILCADSVQGWVLQVHGRKLKLLFTHSLFFDSFSPMLRDAGIDRPPTLRTLQSWRISFNGRLPLSRHSFSVDSYQKTEVSSGESASWLLMSSGKKSR